MEPFEGLLPQLTPPHPTPKVPARFHPNPRVRLSEWVRFLPRFLVAVASDFQPVEVLQQFGVWVLKWVPGKRLPALFYEKQRYDL
ncbi:MAG: hypothetical protein EBT88_09160 [Proteobacteria bacterium]|nr:hypothetical protein [Pseudomonadota bacterium]